jgi:hypothetical protein
MQIHLLSSHWRQSNGPNAIASNPQTPTIERAPDTVVSTLERANMHCLSILHGFNFS